MATPGPKAADATSGGATEPIAVVWCRQVDNEAESPGYTALPNDFPGYQETLDAIRIVGNLAVNVADTQDYWDPDPALPLSYYRNLFLYPAYGGSYTCLGRMFLSTEDRPRLGMKTLVLDTGRLLASGNFGETLLKWYESMGGGRHDQRPPPPADLKLYPLVGEGFLFFRGSTEPVLLIAAEEWEATMETIFEYVRTLPASLLSLGAILAFPYFLPEPKTNLADFAEATPLSLAVLRVPRGESGGERHRKRVQSWEEAPVTLYDLTDGIPSPAGKGKEITPLVVQYVRERSTAKLTPVTERVDRVELRTLRARLADPDRQGGKDRRKEMWRLSTAMESTALLLQKPRGRRLELSPELSRRAQEYLQAHAGEEPAEEIRASDLPPAPPVPVPDPQVAGQLPPWLQRGGTSPLATQRTSKVEVVPMSVKDDPSLQKVPEPGTAPASPGPVIDQGALRRQIEADLMRYLDERLSNVNPVPPAGWTKAFQDELAERFNTVVEQRMRAIPPPRPPEPIDPLRIDGAVQEHLKPALADQAARQAEALKEARSSMEQRFTTWTALQQQALSSLTDRLLARTAELEARLSQDASTRITQTEERVQADLRTIVSQELDQGVRNLVDPKIQEFRTRGEESLKQSAEQIRAELRDSLTQALTDVKTRAQASEEDLRGALVAQLDLHLREAQDRDETQRKELEQKLRGAAESRITEAEQRRAKELQEIERRLSLLIDGRAREVQEKVAAALREAESRTSGLVEEQLGVLEGRGDRKVDAKLEELRDSEMHSVAELQVRLQSVLRPEAPGEPGPGARKVPGAPGTSQGGDGILAEQGAGCGRHRTHRQGPVPAKHRESPLRRSAPDRPAGNGRRRTIRPGTCRADATPRNAPDRRRGPEPGQHPARGRHPGRTRGARPKDRGTDRPPGAGRSKGLDPALRARTRIRQHGGGRPQVRPASAGVYSRPTTHRDRPSGSDPGDPGAGRRHNRQPGSGLADAGAAALPDDRGTPSHGGGPRPHAPGPAPNPTAFRRP